MSKLFIIILLSLAGAVSSVSDYSIHQLRKAAEEGNAEARNYLGFRYYNGDGVARDIDSALFWIKKAASQGDVKAAGNLGYLLSQAPDVEHDYGEAIHWLQIAVDSGLPTAYTQLGDMYRQGHGCAPDTAMAVRLYEKAISLRIADAQQRLLSMMGYKWKELPADSALSLGLKYYPEFAPIAGIDLIENAAQACNPQALALLGDAYSRGIGVPYNHDLSVKYFIEGAIAGNPSAEYILAEMLEFFPDIMEETGGEIQGGINTSEDEFKTAGYWYTKAKEAGITNAEDAYKALFSR